MGIEKETHDRMDFKNPLKNRSFPNGGVARNAQYKLDFKNPERQNFLIGRKSGNRGRSDEVERPGRWNLFF